jgi:hypothetical protein
MSTIQILKTKKYSKRAGVLTHPSYLDISIPYHKYFVAEYCMVISESGKEKLENYIYNQ